MKAKDFLLLVALGCVSTIACPANAKTGQGQPKRHCRLVVLKTLGGPASGTGGLLDGGAGDQIAGGIGALNRRGSAVVVADTNVPGIFHGYRFRGGQVTHLKTLPVRHGSPGNNSYPDGVNDFDFGVGFSENGVIHPLTGFPEIRAVFWSPDGDVRNLGAFGGYQSEAMLINNAGLVAGWMENKIPDEHSWVGGGQVKPYIWRDGNVTIIGTLPDGNNGMPFALNSRGQVVGCTDTSTDVNDQGFVPFAPFLWSEGTLSNLGNLGGQGGCAASINDHGQIAGYSDLVGDMDQHAFLWQGGSLTDLGTLGGLDSGANVINNKGEIVGFAALPDNNGPQIHAALWKDGSVTDLGTLSGRTCSIALDINDREQVVGSSGAPGSCAFRHDQRAFLWENGTMVDLNDLIPPNSNIELQFANTINECGEINGNGVLSTGDPRAFVLIPEGCPGGKGPDVLETSSSGVNAGMAASAAGRQRNRGALLRKHLLSKP